MKGHRIRTLNAESAAEVDLVAQRMGQTLVEVLGAEQGGSMYSHEWLVQRVLWHLDPKQTTGQVFVAEDSDGRVAGHCIVRIQADEDGTDIGLFSTTFVDPASRQRGIAAALLARGEQWMLDHAMATAVTYTDKDNTKLRQLYLGRGYTMTSAPKGFVRLSRPLGPRLGL